jgi:hypothetical protein
VVFKDNKYKESHTRQIINTSLKLVRKTKLLKAVRAKETTCTRIEKRIIDPLPETRLTKRQTRSIFKVLKGKLSAQNSLLPEHRF